MRDLQSEGPMAFWPEIALLPGVGEALEAIGGRVVCCVASNAGDSDAALMGRALERGGIRRHFRHLWTSRELGAAKPAPAFFAAILERLGLEPGECAFVGNDYAKDIAPARAAGMRAIWLNPAASGGGERADAILRTMADLPAALARLQEQ
jgi:FMN phosphatase YigB (HAD superfamily)